jgi:hypothetical protein
VFPSTFQMIVTNFGMVLYGPVPFAVVSRKRLVAHQILLSIYFHGRTVPGGSMIHL